MPFALQVFLLSSGSASAQTQSSVQSFTFLAVGGRVDYSKPKGRIVFDYHQSGAYFDVYTMLTDASDRQCMTCDKPIPQAHNGNPSWSPSGNFIVFQSQNPSLPFLPVEKEQFAQVMTGPGWGTNNNLWLMTSDATHFWQLTDVEAGMGTLHPQFSNSGAKVLWAEKIGLVGVAEQWTIRLSDLVWTDKVPQLTNITSIHPLGIDIFYETHGFSPDDSKILFAAGDPSLSSLDVYTYDLATGAWQNLTNTPGEWDEHAHFTPDGTKIIWASSRDITTVRNYFVPYLDYWIMNPDGTGQRRLSYFNDPLGSAPEYYPAGLAAADFAFLAGSRWLLGKFEVTGLVPQNDRVDVITAIQLTPGAISGTSRQLE